MYVYNHKLIQQIKAHLRNGGVIAYPTESCYGLGCDPFNYRAINKIIRIKGRSKTKGLIVIAGKLEQLNTLIQPLPASSKAELAHYWPGFYSLILKVTRKVPRNLIGAHRKIAVRVTQHRAVQQLCRELQQPLVSTSANKTGCKPIKSYRECLRQFGKQVLVLPGLIGLEQKPSTIIDWESKKILRK